MNQKISAVKVEKMPVNSHGGQKGNSMYQDIFDILKLAEVGDVFKFGPWASTKLAAAAQTSISHFMVENKFGYSSSIRNNKGDYLADGESPYVYVEKKAYVDRSNGHHE